MENIHYEIVNSDENLQKTFSWKYLLRQVLVCSVIIVLFFTYGMYMGAPTVFIPQLRREANSTDYIDDSMASWMTSMFAVSSIPWTLILPVIAVHFGRKIPHVILCFNFVISNLIFYFSTNLTHIIISQAMGGAIGGALLSISIMVLTEYTSPKYRGVILTFKSATLFWGIWASNAIGTFFHWKNIALTSLILSFYPLIVVFFWPESPYYLASKEKFDDCIKAHKWLKGNTADSELKRLLTKTRKNNNLKSIMKTVLSKSFYKPTLLGICVFMLYTFSGKFVCTMYSLDIIKKITSSERTAYIGMLILDGVTVLGMYIGTLISHFMKRRTLFFSATILGVVTLFALSLYTYLVSSSIIVDNKYVSIGLLAVYSMGICCGPLILSTSLFGELTPLECRSVCVCIVTCTEKVIMSIVSKSAPFVIKTYGLHIAFLSFGLTSLLCILLLYIYMPETKDKTLYEIADAIVDVTNNSDSKKFISK